MADTVQVLMEKMIPELEDLQARKLLSAAEVRQVVARRRDFEYAMKRIPLRALDALRYIEYELNLDALRVKRKARLALQKPSLSDAAGVRRVHSIFDRVLAKHRGRVDLWLQYIAFCKEQGSSRVLSHVFSRALQSHPRRAEIWIEAASYEFSTNLSVAAARVLMQRAIRINRESPRLWLEYFRLELLYIQKLAVRREILKLDEQPTASNANDNEDDDGTVRIDPLPEETSGQDDGDVEAQTAKQQARQQILDGAIARIIYENAVAAIPTDVAFRLQFVDISDLFGRHFAGDLSEFVLASCAEAFPKSELVQVVRALRPLATLEQDADAEAELRAEQQVIRNLEASVSALDTTANREQFADWLVERLALPTKSDALVRYASAKLRELAEGDEPSSKIAVKYIDVVHRTRGTSSALEAARELTNSRLAVSAELWLLQSQLAFHAHSSPKTTTKRQRTSNEDSVKPSSASAVDEAVRTLRTATTKLASSDYAGLFAVHSRLAQLLVANPSSSARDVQKAFETGLRALQHGSALWSQLRLELLSWAATALPLEQVRAIYSQFLVASQLLPTAATRAFLELCVAVETSAVPSSSVEIRQVRVLFEKLVDLFGSESEDVWVAYVACLGETLGLVADAAKVLQRAVRQWPESSSLAQLSLTGGH